MPIVIINSLPPSDDGVIEGLLRDIRDKGAEAMQCAPDNIWVMFRPISAGQYLHGDKPAAKPQARSHPPVVIILAQVGRNAAQRDSFAKAVSSAIGRAFSIPPDNVWIHYQEMKPQDVWFGGRWAA